MRAPPEVVTTTNGNRRSRASSAVNVIISPAAEPRLPPMKEKSMTATASSRPPMRPVPHSTASGRPVRRRASCQRSSYRLPSEKSRGS